jgi:hypothetical protein
MLAYFKQNIFLQPMKLLLPCQDWNVVCTITILLLGPFSLKTPFKSEYYVDMVYEFLGHLTEEKIARVWFHQDSPTCHAAQVTV